MSETMTEAELFEGKPLPAGGVVLGEDFYAGDPDPTDGRPQNTGDAISEAVGAPGYMANFMVQECKQVFADGSETEPEEFDRYYFPPQAEGYDGPAPILIDLLAADDPETLAQERIDKHVAFKTEWCAKQGVRYAVLHDMEDLMVSVEALRARLLGEEPPTETPPAEAESAPEEPQKAPQRPRKRTVQRPRAKS